MAAKIISEENPDWVSEAVYVLANAGMVIAPSETCYGILADASNENAVKKIYRVKKRPELKSISIFVLNGRMLSQYAQVSALAKLLVKKYLPGPLTLVLKKKKPFKLAKNLSAKNTIAIRISSHPLIQAMLHNYGKPLTATSANLSGEGESYSSRQIIPQFGNLADMIIDAGNLVREPPSTVVDCTGKKLKILRQGKLKIRL